MTVRVGAKAGTTEVEVVDDGVGGADPEGTGLRGLSDRVAALGGVLALSSELEQGTALRAKLPHD